ncbi:hypothetical protein [Halorubrum sp. Boch-26]|uniref:hypothetical protein n=1 Tax=Halorubrum sp. Boch-26 TaxID=2994426 RepID=UPI002468DE3A|nr:hypothetical protein [Halorubrum sp. Boch-26]
MPIDTNSDIWKESGSDDPLRVHITELLSNNSEEAFSIKEIDEYLIENYQHLYPTDLTGEDSITGATAARQSIVSNILLNRYWHAEVRFNYISGEGQIDSGLYFTWEGGGIYPIAEIDDVTDVGSDSPHMTLESRFRQVEADLNEEVSELEDRLDYLEYQVHRE